LTSWYFALDSSLINGYILYQAYQFFKQGTDPTARKLFMTSLWHLPALMLLLLVHKTDPATTASLLDMVQQASS
jgi:protoheme IX farnesyltransferase